MKENFIPYYITFEWEIHGRWMDGWMDGQDDKMRTEGERGRSKLILNKLNDTTY